MKTSSSKLQETLLTVPLEQAGKRLDQFLSMMLLDISRTRIRELIEKGCVVSEFQNKTLKPSFVVKEGQKFKVTVPPVQKTDIEGQAIDLDVIYEDKDLLVINKPMGLVVHPGAGNPDKTLINALVAHCPNITGVGGVQRPGLVHRLDKNTTGLLVAAKSDIAYKGLVKQLKDRSLSREYLGIVRGRLDENGMVDAAIGRHTHSRKKMSVQAESGRNAVTHFRTLKISAETSLLLLKLETGRTHQIRVHMNFIKHPILGDKLYGDNSGLAERQMLHAFRLSFKHPKTGIKKSFFAPPPTDFNECLLKLAMKVPNWKEITWEK